LNKKNILIAALSALLCTFLFCASLLGENHRAREIVNAYLEDLIAGNFSASCVPVKLFSTKETDIQRLSCEDKNFLFMVALQSYSSSALSQKIPFETELNQYWIPYLTDDVLKIGLSYESSEKSIELSNLFIIEREGWSWTLSEIQVTNQELSATFSRFTKLLDLRKFVLEKNGLFRFQSAEIDVHDLTPIEKKVLKYNLEKVYRHLE